MNPELLYHNIYHTQFIKKKIIFFLFGLIQSCIKGTRRVAAIVGESTRPAASVVWRFLAPPTLWLYGHVVHFRITLSAQKKTAGHILLAPKMEVILRTLAMLFLAVLALLPRTSALDYDGDFLEPNNILALYIVAEGDSPLFAKDIPDVGVPEDQEQFNTDAVRSAPIPEEKPSDNGTIAPEVFPSQVAVYPDAIIKPIIPTGEIAAPFSQKIQTYIIREGDTISTVAGRFGLKAITLLWANGLTDRSVLRVGQKLTIPPLDGLVYTVRSGDTLGKIANTYNTDIEKIVRANQLANEHSLQIGQILILPGATQPAVRTRVSSPTLLGRIRDAILPSPSSQKVAGLFIWPTTARRITQYFGWRHTGVDIAGPTSNSILAAAAGKVILSGWQRGYGYTIVIDHGNGYQTRYAHSRKLLVQSGEYVEQGQVIAMVGSTGWSTGPHVHFEVMKNGRRQNPLSYIK
ncbi:peptidoglycan DD-metalloendopeptidase family protein [Candidatus Uhrbacteria bacterium]|nr:peptidoglycan DD-metalloendopeptidase family protein [Candidatus Uhrbacteria bacterium]